MPCFELADKPGELKMIKSALVSLIVMCIGTASAVNYSGGTGTAENPYQISTVEDWTILTQTPADWDKYFILMNDIDFEGAKLAPIGNFQPYFSGTFDGGGNLLSNFVIEQPDKIGVGLWGNLSGCSVISNVVLQDVHVTGKKLVGALAGGSNGTIANCSVLGGTVTAVLDVMDDPMETETSGIDVGGLVGTVWKDGHVKHCTVRNVDVNGARLVGGLTGWVEGGLVSDSTVIHGTVTGFVDVGGLAGTLDKGGKIMRCTSSATVSGILSVGGLVGQTYMFDENEEGFDKCTIEFSSASGNVTGEFFTGGLVGFNDDQTIIRASYALGDVSGILCSGGLAGGNAAASIIEDCYAVGSVSGDMFTGGLVGLNGLKEIEVDTGETELLGAIVRRSYAVATVTGQDENTTGALIGGQGVEVLVSDEGEEIGEPADVGELENSFWNLDVNPHMSGVGYGNSTGAEGKTSTEMKIRGRFEDAGWDFLGEAYNGTNDIWRMCVDGMDYPRLQWQFSKTGDFDCPDGVGTEDLIYLAERWLLDDCNLGNNNCEWADIDRDGVVNIKDFLVLAKKWLQVSP